jgi:hypothetical protein
VAHDWREDLKTLDLDGVKPFYPSASAGMVTSAVGLREDRKLVRKSTRREFIHALHVANAAKTLERLPGPGESFHVAMAGNFNAWDLVPAVLRIAALRSHAKLLLFELTDGRKITVESSANLRSCRNVEQFSMTNDPALLSFHAGWIDELLTEAGA